MDEELSLQKIILSLNSSISNSNSTSNSNPSDINRLLTIDPRFRMILLANRPGHPFLGNDFFYEIGDVLSCHLVDNPSIDSEMQLLQQYAPHLPHQLRSKLCRIFAKLRAAVDNGSAVITTTATNND